MYEIVTGLPELPVGNWAHVYFTSGYVAFIEASSQPPSKMIATCFLPSESPHQLSPRSLAVIARPFLNRSRYHWMADLLAELSIADDLLSDDRSEPPWA